MRVAVIGPIRPFRGGISHSNTILCKNLSKNHKVRVYSFKRLFPRFLYPGKFQIEKGKNPPKDLDVDFCIDSINPFNWHYVAKKINEFKPEVVIFQWWTTFLFFCYSFIAKKIKENSHISVIAQCALPHETNRIHYFLAKKFYRYADSFVTLSSADLKEVKKIIPGAKVSFIVEPTYESQIEKASTSKPKARKKLGIKKPCILFFGFVRPYKGLEYLLKAMPKVLKEKDIQLLIVGEFWEPKDKYVSLIKKLGIEDNVTIVDRYVSDEEAALYFAASDAVVLPYTSSTESGIIQLAFGLNVPVITTEVGGNPDLIKHKKNGLLVKPRNEKKLAKAILKYYEKGFEKKFKKEMLKDRKKFEWNKEKEKAVLGLS